MKFYIRLKDGEPYEHPITEGNFAQAFPNVDTLNLPPEFAEFERVEQPSLGVYEIYEGVVYEFHNGVVKDVHSVRPMNYTERLDKQNQIKTLWETSGFSSWVFNEKTCSFDPPISYPDDGNIYIWKEESLGWVLLDSN